MKSLPLIRRALAATAALAAFSAVAANKEAVPAPSGPTLDRIKQTGKIIIAHRESSVPLSYVDANKKPVGYAVDLCLKLADAVKKKLNMPKLEVSYVMVTGATRIPVIAEGKADLECGSTTNNAERRQKVAFTVPHYITGARYLVRADSKIDDLPNFDGKKLVSTKGTTPLKAVNAANKERLIGITVLEAADHAAAVAMVENGEADGFAMDDVLLYGLRSERPDPNKLKVVGKFLTIEPLAIMLSKDDPEFKRIIDDEMKRMITSREAYAIYDKWFTQPIPPKNVSLNMPMNYLLKDFWKYPTDQVPY
ncbi:amino acid ABC transporter substrate-binding protein [Piscinibacter terrae]|uniref:Amino acid ABC transporter substrate-binding protein n=1 Tax=Piscinibacter terrae TaxID=2496871 RepID=A0A3N7IR70_9BURK|nr:amino acid ABC transporter substrate-binding protein [Albitalea terrae]